MSFTKPDMLHHHIPPHHCELVALAEAEADECWPGACFG